MAATAPPSPDFTPARTDQTKGPIPFERHHAALANARAKTEAEVGQRFQQHYAPHIQLGARFQADPVGTMTQLLQEFAAHPTYGPQMASWFGQGSQGSPGQAAYAEPGPDLQTNDGIQVYSAEQQAKREAWFRQQIDRSIEERLSPLQDREHSTQVQERLAMATRDAHTRMSRVLAPYASDPEFVAHRPAIAVKVQDLLEEGLDPATALGVAYASVLRETVLPSRTAQSQQQLMASAVAKATGATQAPGSASASHAARPTSMAEAFGRVIF